MIARVARIALPLVVIGLASCGEPSPAAPDGPESPESPSAARAPGDAGQAVQLYRVKFEELNGSGVKAQATLAVRGTDLTVTLNAVGRVPGQIHPQHIHGFTTQTSTCPTAANDANGDGTISFAEGSPSFGPVQVDLQPYPTPTNSAGSTHYRLTFGASDVHFAPSELTEKTMVLHGDFVGGGYVPGLPVACGRVEAVN